MKKWLVFNEKMDCIGSVMADDFNDAWAIASQKYRSVDYIQPIQKEKKMIFSDCCGVEMNGIQADYGLCPDCGEHCDVVVDDSEEN